MAEVKQKNNIHLLWRAGFGPSINQINSLNKHSPKHTWKELLKASSNPVELYNEVDSYITDTMMSVDNTDNTAKGKPTEADKKILRDKNTKSINALNARWLNDMVNSEAQLREKMAFFWHGHFACRSTNAIYQQQLLNAIRSNALGNFKDLLFEVSKSAAMLNFLNNNQNRKNHPNENFAREVMELFTIGRGNYSENDIKEAARAFTGWGANAKGEFIFRQKQHDKEAKNFMGKTGNLNGDDILNILLEQKKTAFFITHKLYTFLVNEIPDEVTIQLLADKFYKSNYDIQLLLNDIFLSDWFYNEKNIGVKIKSPVELLAGIQRILPVQIESKDFIFTVQKILGQLLLYPPNVAGWPGGKTWIDSSTLIVRMRLPKILSDADTINIKPKDDDDQMMGRPASELNSMIKSGKKKNNLLGKEVITSIDWSSYLYFFSKIKKEDLTTAMLQLLLQTGNNISEDLIKQHAVIDGREQFIKTATIEIMCLPEYQMC